MTVLSAALLLSAVAFGRGERWIDPPPPAPPVATPTNEARYLEWKWRTDASVRLVGRLAQQAEKVAASGGGSLGVENGVCWNDMKKVGQDRYIARAESLMQ